MVDLQTQYRMLKNEIDEAVIDVMEACRFINGPEVGVFAKELSKYLSHAHVIPCANGTDALQLALMALDLKPGDEVITSTFSFVATAEVITLLGLKPVFVDVDPSTFNIDVEKTKEAVSPATKVIMPVHLFGQGADMNTIMQIAEEYDLYVVEDAAQSLGGSCKYRGKEQKLGTIGHIGCTSFFPSKNLGGFGDGGACFTNDPSLAEKMKMIASHGSKKRYYHKIVGVNSRLDTMQAAVLNVKLPYLDRFIEGRRRVADLYNSLLKGVKEVIIPGIENECLHTYNQYTLRVKNDKQQGLKKFLEENGIPARVYYPLALHQQEAYKEFWDGKPLAVAELLCNEVLSLPVYPEMPEETALMIGKTINAFFENQ